MKQHVNTQGMARLLFICTVTLTIGHRAWCQEPSSDAVVVPAGSADALADAIVQAGPGGKVVLASGVHHQNGTVMVTIPVTISGEEGAVILSDVPADGPPPPFLIVPTLHIKGTHSVVVEGIAFEPSQEGTPAGTAVVIESTPNATIRNNAITNYQFGVLIQGGDNAVVSGNQIHVADGVGGRGINAINGHAMQLTDNVVVGGFIGVFCAGAHGLCRNNLVESTNRGIVLCTVGDNVFNIGGKAPGGAVKITGWTIANNEVNNNQRGILLIGGTPRNTLANNRASGNALADLEMTADSAENIVAQDADHPLTVKDCGIDNIIIGNVTLLDGEAEPCL